MVGEGQKLTQGAALKERLAFKKAGAKIESAAKLCSALPKKCGF